MALSGIAMLFGSKPESAERLFASTEANPVWQYPNLSKAYSQVFKMSTDKTCMHVNWSPKDQKRSLSVFNCSSVTVDMHVDLELYNQRSALGVVTDVSKPTKTV